MYDLTKVEAPDEWVIELSYEQTGAYAAGVLPSPVQRVAFAAELFDEGERPVSPQSFLQGLPIGEMTRFSVRPPAVGTPVLLVT